MKINKDNTKKRLQGVPDGDQVFIYDAGIIIRFLRETFMPTVSFFPEGYAPKPASPIDLASFSEQGKEHSMSVRDLYEVYGLWRERQEFTREIETPYVFSLIVKRLRYYRNGVEFHVFRRGVAQIWYVGPLVYRKDVTPGERERYAISAPGVGMDPGAPDGERTVVISPRMYDTFKPASRFTEVKGPWKEALAEWMETT